jgi:capsular exopolysaccharide synthesis family protein
MGKIYDALRKAEAERAPGAAVPTAPGPGPVERSAPARRAPSAGGRLSRWASGVRGLLRSAPAPEDVGAINKRRIALLHPNSYVTEQFRTLRARLDSLAAERPIGVIALTSALPGEGKTTAAANLAIVSAMSVGRKVLLIDCDLRRPKIQTALGLRPEFGLAEVLTGQTSVDRALVKVDGTNLDVLPVRGTPSNPSELLATDRMRSLIEELRRSYDLVLLDTPPVLALPDAKILSEIADGVVLVVRASETPREDVEAALDVVDRRRVLGVVLNGAEVDQQRYGY